MLADFCKQFKANTNVVGKLRVTFCFDLLITHLQGNEQWKDETDPSEIRAKEAHESPATMLHMCNASKEHHGFF